MQQLDDVAQPMQDAHGNVLLWNGEVFGVARDAGWTVAEGQNDTQAVLAALVEAGDQVMDVFEAIEGPFAAVFYHAASRRLWYGRDKLARRNLLLQWDDKAERLTISSNALVREEDDTQGWTEVSNVGMFCLQLPHAEEVGLGVLSLRPWRHVRAWRSDLPEVIDDAAALELGCRTVLVEEDVPLPVGSGCGMDVDWSQLPELVPPAADVLNAVQAAFLFYLARSVRARVRGVLSPHTTGASVGVLFSGGIDCIVLAALADRFLPPGQPVDLINVAFVGHGEHDASVLVPDRVTGINGLLELQRVAPTREWRLVEVDVTLQQLEDERARLLRLLHPSDTVMDFNIASMLWFGSMACGVVRDWTAQGVIESEYCRYVGVDQEEVEEAEEVEALVAQLPEVGDDVLGTVVELVRSGYMLRLDEFPGALVKLQTSKLERKRAKQLSGKAHELEAGRRVLVKVVHVSEEPRVLAKLVEALDEVVEVVDEAGEEVVEETGAELPVGEAYESTARVLLVGIGADEQLAGYKRHRNAFRRHGWEGLAAELDRDKRRLWRRNLGRDDRVVADSGREARHPFLDEHVVSFLASVELASVCDLTLPAGVGDKKLLRDVARVYLGLKLASSLEKRAIQFGSRIANRKVPGETQLVDSVALADMVNPRLLESTV